ncbi:MAG: FadR/GntR family transcriptional regulator [Ancrocorticia sp.]|uniref:FadR/GntR family transcriptional regulator n=1 Tax=Ancrocorticia sp. TaxID=2593684 RepID=UPI003F8F82E8
MQSDSGKELLHLHISQSLGVAIIEGAWPQGSSRTLEAIQDGFDVSRTVAREASRLLESLGLVQARRRVGLTAQPMSSWNVLDPQLINWRLHSTDRENQIYSLTQLRLAVEPAAAEGAARLASVHTRAQLLPIASEMRRTGEAGQLDEFMELDIAFHSLLLRGSGNELFAAMADLVAVVLQWRTEFDLMPAQPKPEALDLHEEVADAVFRGEAQRARDSMEKILEEVRETFDDAAQTRAGLTRWARSER